MISFTIVDTDNKKYKLLEEITVKTREETHEDYKRTVFRKEFSKRGIKKEDVAQEQIESKFKGNYPFSSYITGETINSKIEYNESKHWIITRRNYITDVRKRQDELENPKKNLMCEECGMTVKVAVHHLDYSNVGSESWSDLKLLCYKCHSATHKRLKSLECTLHLGKYKGNSLKEIIESDINYIDWAINNGVFKLDRKAKKYYKSIKE